MATKYKLNYELKGDSTVPVTRTECIKHGDSMLNTVIDSMTVDEFERWETEPEFSEKKTNRNAFSSFTKQTYGIYEDATVMSVIANGESANPQILGTDTKGLASYTNRDSAAIYAQNTGAHPTLTVSSGMTYTSNTATLPAGTDMSKIKTGMIIDTGNRTDVNTSWYVGIIKSISGNTLTMEDGFYLVRNDGTEPTKGTPSNASCKINDNSKVWVENLNLFINDGCSAGTALEIGVFANTKAVDDVAGIDVVNAGEVTHYGVRVRGNRNGFNYAYMADGQYNAYTSRGSSGARLVTGISNNNEFYITNDGQVSKTIEHMTVVNEDAYIGNYGGIYMVATATNIFLPPASGNAGRILEFVILAAHCNIKASSGNGIVPKSGDNVETLVAEKGDKRTRYLRLCCDGGTTWYVICDN